MLKSLYSSKTKIYSYASASGKGRKTVQDFPSKSPYKYKYNLIGGNVDDSERDKLNVLESAIKAIESDNLSSHTPRVYTIEGKESVKNILFLFSI